MIQPTKHRGTVVPVVTPVTDEGILDEASAERLVNRLAGHGLGVFVLGTTGEAASVPASLRRRWVQIAVKAAAGRVPVYAGIGDNCLSESAAAGNEFLSLGVDAAVAHLPCYYTLSPAEMQVYFELLAGSLDGALIVYNIPPTTHMSIPLEVVQHLSDLPNVVGCKDSERSVERMETLVARLGGRGDFALFMGIAAFSVRALRLGYAGLVPSSGNLAPELWAELGADAAAGDWAHAEALQTRLDEVARVFQAGRTLGQSLAALKAAMSVRGYCRPAVLPPLRSLPADEIRMVATQLTTLGLVSSPAAAGAVH